MADRIPTSNSKFAAPSVRMAALGTAKTRGVCSPVTGYVVAIMYGADLAVTANEDPQVLTGKINGTDITGGAISLTSALAAGKTSIVFPTGANRVKRGDYLSMTSTALDDGGDPAVADDGSGNIVFLIEQD